MTEVAPKNQGGFPSGGNNVHKFIKEIQAAKATGKFTFQAGRADRVINLALGLGMCYIMYNVGSGIHQMAYGYGRKDGF